MSLLLKCIYCKGYYNIEKMKQLNYTDKNTFQSKTVYVCKECVYIVLKLS